MKFESQICTTKEQSERLLALGLKKETADCFLEYIGRDNYGNNVWHSSIIVNNYRIPDYSRDIPAWSLHRLIEMMPKTIVKDLIQWYLSITPYYNDLISYENCGNLEVNYLYKSGFNCLYDNIINCIKLLIEEGYFNKEYLND